MAPTTSQKSSTSALECVVVTPEATVVETPADFVALPLFDGEAGIAPGRAPLIGRLGYGELRIRVGQAEKNYYVDGGFVQVADNVVSVLTGRATPAREIDVAAASEQLADALARKTAGREEMALRDRHLSQARGLLRVARRAGQTAN